MRFFSREQFLKVPHFVPRDDAPLNRFPQNGGLVQLFLVLGIADNDISAPECRVVHFAAHLLDKPAALEADVARDDRTEMDARRQPVSVKRGNVGVGHGNKNIRVLDRFPRARHGPDFHIEEFRHFRSEPRAIFRSRAINPCLLQSRKNGFASGQLTLRLSARTENPNPAGIFPGQPFHPHRRGAGSRHHCDIIDFGKLLHSDLSDGDRKQLRIVRIVDDPDGSASHGIGLITFRMDHDLLAMG